MVSTYLRDYWGCSLNLIERLTRALSRLPGLGRKSASRIVYYLLKADSAFVEQLADEMKELKAIMQSCRICGNYTDIQPCSICSDSSRDRSIICVVEEPKDVLSIEAIREFQGNYHVLKGAISPIDGIGPDQLRISSLMERIKKENIKEIIMATNPTVEGDTTALYLTKLLRQEKEIRVSRLALGLPVGGDLEYADRLTLMRAFKGRNII